MNDKQIDLQSLRKLAEAAEKLRYIYEAARNIDHPSYPGSDECEAWEDALEQFEEAANPAAVLELLDMVEGMRNCQNCRNYPNHGSYGSCSGNTELCKNWQWEGE